MLNKLKKRIKERVKAKGSAIVSKVGTELLQNPTVITAYLMWIEWTQGVHSASKE